jgi:hypothetical protein
VVASGLVAVLLFTTLLAREAALTTDIDIDQAVRPMNAVLLALGVAFVLNVAVEAAIVLS